jgi:WD40 repeat protein
LEGTLKSPIYCLDWSGDGLLVTGSADGNVTLWKVFSDDLQWPKRFNEVTKLQPMICIDAHTQPVKSVMWYPFSPEEGYNLFASGGDDFIKIWDARDLCRPKHSFKNLCKTAFFC